MTQSDIFSRATRRRFSDRAFTSSPEDRWLTRLIAVELADRLGAINRSFERVLIIGDDGGELQNLIVPNGLFTVIADSGFKSVAAIAGVQCDEDRLPFADTSFDLILAPRGLDTVNDLPGALILIRRILAHDGLFLGAMAGAGGLAMLRNIASEVNRADQMIARHHPQIDVRGAGDLLSRAGFALPVAESHLIKARYPSLFKLIADLRANAMTNALIHRKPLVRNQLAQMAENFLAAGNGKTEETFSLIYMTGWAAERFEAT
jgi:NADH dehydrogenase [ubiquinone] 1 alpha subcomplex assembly factor 5